jgi:hypothetical protein
MTVCSQVGEIYATIDCTDDGENGFPRLRVGHQTLCRMEEGTSGPLVAARK